jgi:hypothetical protein
MCSIALGNKERSFKIDERVSFLHLRIPLQIISVLAPEADFTSKLYSITKQA